MNTQRLAWYLVRIKEYSCVEGNEPVFTLKDIQLEFKVKHAEVMKEIRAMHHLLEIHLIPYPIRVPVPSRGKKRSKKTRLVDVLFFPRIKPGCFVTFTNRKGSVETLEAHGKYTNNFLHRKKVGKGYKTFEIYQSSDIDDSFES